MNPKFFQDGGYIQQLFILNSYMKLEIYQGGGKFNNFSSHTENCKMYIDIFMGFPAILNTLQPFHMCIFNGNQSQLTFSNWPQVMGKRFMANLHASLDSTWKSRFSKISTRCHIWGGTFHNICSQPQT